MDVLVGDLRFEDRKAGGTLEAGADAGMCFQIFSEANLLMKTILEAFQILREEGIRVLGQGIDHPLGSALGLDDAEVFHVTELFGNFDLVGLEDLHKVANTEWTSTKEVQNAQALDVAQAFVDINYLHMNVYALKCIFLQGEIRGFFEKLFFQPLRLGWGQGDAGAGNHCLVRI